MEIAKSVLFGLFAVLLVGGTVLPAMSQTETEEKSSLIEINLDSSAYDLNERISISGKVIDFVPNNRDPSLDMITITFVDPIGKIVSSSGYGKHSGEHWTDSNQPLTFKATPNQSGTFALSTSLSSVLFDYGTYSVNVSTYQNGNISESLDFEIAPPVEEAAVVIENPVEFEFCTSTRENVSADQIHKDFKDGLDSIQCIGADTFQAGDKIIISGNVHIFDTSSDSRVSNENKQAQSSQGAPSFVQVKIPYQKALVMRAALEHDFITTTGVAVAVDKRIMIDSVTLTVLPDEKGNFSGVIDLPQTIFDSGLYIVEATYEKHKFEKVARIIHPSMDLDAAAEIIISTDKNEYKPGEIVHISGQIQNSFFPGSITIYVDSPDVSAFNCMEITCLADSTEKEITPESGFTTHTFSWDYQLADSEASIGSYTINAGSHSVPENAVISFFVTEESSVADTAITPEEPSPMKKIIKKFNRIADSSISISLDGAEENSELAPRVIQGSLFTAARGQEANVNIQVSTSDGQCIIGQNASCMISESTRKPGAIYEIVTIGEESYKIRYSGADVKLEKFSILPNTSGVPIEIQDWDVKVIKDDQPTRFYYKVSYVDLG